MTVVRFEFKGKQYTIDRWLASQLDSVVYNLKKDWDFVILITGDRSVRVGKSVLGMIVCAYLAHCLIKLKLNNDPYSLKNVFFDNRNMMEESQKRPKHSVIHYDEGREGLAAIKSMREFQQDLMDFFAECGQLNHVFVIVCPDFFELKEEIAVGRSEFLINVYRKDVNSEVDMYNDGILRPIVVLRRGFFEFFSRRKKALLYDKAKSLRKKNYSLVKCNFNSNFSNQYPLGEEEYKQMKRDSLARFAERHKETKMTSSQIQRKVRNAYIRYRHSQKTRYADILNEIQTIFVGSINNELLDISERQLKRICIENKDKTVAPDH